MLQALASLHDIQCFDAKQWPVSSTLEERAQMAKQWHNFDWRVVVRFSGVKRQTVCWTLTKNQLCINWHTLVTVWTLAWLLGGERSTCCWWCNMRAGGHWRPMEPPSPHSQSRLTSRPHTSSHQRPRSNTCCCSLVEVCTEILFVKPVMFTGDLAVKLIHSWWPKIVSGIP